MSCDAVVGGGVVVNVIGVDVLWMSIKPFFPDILSINHLIS